MKLKTLLMSAAMSGLIAGGAVAQSGTTGTTAPADGSGMASDATGMNAGAVAQFSSLSDMTVGDLIGQNVYTPEGDTIGDVDYVVGQSGGAEAIVGIGGFLGLGEYTVALPLEEFEYDSSQQMVTLNATKDQLKQRPEYDESDAESLPDETRLADLMMSDDMSGDAAKSDDMSDDTATSDDMSDDAATSDDMSGDAATSDDATKSDDDAPKATGETDGDTSKATDDATGSDDTGTTDDAEEKEKTDG